MPTSRGQAKRKTAKKTAGPRLVPQPGGRGALLTGGVPGNKGGTGRPPNWLKDWCDEKLADPKARRSVETILRNPKHPAFVTMWRAVADRAHGKPVQPISGSVTLLLEDIVAASRKVS